MSHNLQVKVRAAFDRKEITNQLNQQLKTQIQPNINKIKINIDIDQRAIASMRKIADSLNVVKDAFKEQSKVIKQHEEVIKLDGNRTKTLITQYLKSGEVIDKSRTVTDKRTKSVEKHTAALRMEQSELDKLGVKLKENIRLNSQMQELGRKETYGSKNFNTVVSSNSDGKVTGLTQNNNYASEQKDLEIQKKKREQLEHQLKLYKQMAQIRFDNLSRNNKLTIEQRNELNRLNQSIQALTVNTPKLQQQIDRSRVAFKQFTSDVNLGRNSFDKFGDSVSNVVSKIAIWAGGMTLLYAPLRGLRETIDLLYEVDAQMTQLKRVMSDDSNFSGILDSSIEMTKQLGQSITTVLEQVGQFARQGFDEIESVALAKTATLAMNISELEAKEAVDAITAAMIIWNIEADKSITIVDKLNSIDNNFSVTTKDLAISMQKASATAKNFGVDLNTLLGHTTATGAATRETGSVIGNSLRTIYSRITTMTDAETALNGIGISIRDMAGDMRPVQDTLTDVQAVWKGLNNEQRQNISYTLAGRYQLNRFTSLMENWQMGLEAAETAMYSTNSAIDENAKYLESLEARTNLMKASWQELALTMGDAVINDSLIGLINIGTDLATTMTNVVDKVGLMPVVFGAVGIAIGLVNAGVRSFTINIVNAIRAASGLPPILATSTTASLGFAGALTTVKVALRGLLASTGVGLVLAGIGLAAELLISKFGGAKDSIDEITESLTTMDSRVAELQRLEQLNKQYDELNKFTDKTAQQKIKLSSIEQELSDKYQINLVNLENEAEAYKVNNGLIEQQIGLLKEEIAAKQEKEALEFRSNESKLREEIEASKKEAEEAEQAYLKAKNAREAFIAARDSGQTIDNSKGQFWESDFLQWERSPDHKQYADFVESIGELTANALKEANDKFSKASNDYNAKINSATQGMRSEFRNYISALEVSGKEIDPATRVVFDALASLDAEFNLSINTKDMQDFFVLVNDNKGSLDDIDNLLSKRFPHIKDQLGSSLKEMQDGFLKLNRVVIDTDETLEDNMSSMDDLSKTIDSTVSELSELNEILYKVKNGQSLTGVEVDKLTRAYPELKKGIIQTADGYSIEEEALGLVRQAKLDYLEASQLAEAGIDEAVYYGLQNRLENYGIELDAIQSLADARAAISGYSQELAEKGMTISHVPKEYIDTVNQLNKLGQIRENFNKLYANPNFGVTSGGGSKSKSGSSSSKDKDEAKLQDATQARINAINKEADALSKSNTELEKKINSEDTVAVQMKRTNDLYVGQIDEINALRVAMNGLWSERDKLVSGSKYSQSTFESWIDQNGEATESFIKLYNSMKSGSAQSELQGLFDKYQSYTIAIRDNRKSVSELEAENKKLLKSLQALREENTRNWIEKNTEAYNDFQDAITASERNQMRYFDEGSEGWYREQQNQIDTYKQWQNTLKNDNDIYRSRIKQSENARAEDKLTEQQLKDLEAQIKANSDAWWQYEQNIINITKSVQTQRETWADKVISDYKDLLKKQQDLTNKSLEAQKDAENERHENKMKNLAEEYSEFEKLINAQMKALDRENASEDYDEQLNKLLSERAKIDNQISVLALDDSFEAKAKRKALEEELRLKDEEITKFQRDRERELRKQGLQDQLEDRKEIVDKQEKIEDEQHNNTIKNIEDLIKANDTYYEGLLGNEQMFYDMKQELMSEDITNVKNQLAIINQAYNAHLKDLVAQSALYGEQIRDNLIYSTEKNQDYANSIPNTGNSNSSSNSTNTTTASHKATAWTEYLENKRKAEAMGSNKGAEFEALKKRNDQLRQAWGFQDGSYAQLKDIKVYHNGGEVGVEGSTTKKWIDKLLGSLNLKSDEQLAVLRNKEVVLNDPISNINEIVSRSSHNNFEKMIVDRNSNSNQKVAPAINNYSVNIDKVIGDERGAKLVADTALGALKRMENRGIRT